MDPVWKKHRGLVWSNSQASDSIRIRAALLRPRFLRLLDIADAFGIERLREEWAALTDDPNSDGAVERARAPVERILHNIEEGFRRATSA